MKRLLWFLCIILHSLLSAEPAQNLTVLEDLSYFQQHLSHKNISCPHLTTLCDSYAQEKNISDGLVEASLLEIAHYLHHKKNNLLHEETALFLHALENYYAIMTSNNSEETKNLNKTFES